MLKLLLFGKLVLVMFLKSSVLRKMVASLCLILVLIALLLLKPLVSRFYDTQIGMAIGRQLIWTRLLARMWIGIFLKIVKQRVFHLSLEQQSPDGFVKVYRFENSLGEGPYVGYTVNALRHHNSTTGHPPLLLEQEENEHGHPVLDQEFNTYRVDLLTAWETRFSADTFVCAFRSMIQLNAWFIETEIQAMADESYHLTSYLVPKEYIMYGRKQVLIHKEYKIKCEL